MSAIVSGCYRASLTSLKYGKAKASKEREAAADARKAALVSEKDIQLCIVPQSFLSVLLPFVDEYRLRRSP